MQKPSMGFKCLGLLICLAVTTACSQAKDSPPPQPSDSAPGFSLADGGKPEDKAAGAASFSEGSGTQVKDHPEIKEGEKIERRVSIPENVQGKWKAVKILVKDKTNEENNAVKTVDLGSSFLIANTQIKVTVGPFLPNFVMDKGTYTSMNNEVINPAVQLLVEENGQVLYKGWTFAKYPAMYAFEHAVYALELSDYIAADVS